MEGDLRLKTTLDERQLSMEDKFCQMTSFDGWHPFIEVILILIFLNLEFGTKDQVLLHFLWHYFNGPLT